jgi:hypothetical protein
MLKTMLTVAALALVQAAQLPAAYAGAQGVILHGGTAGSGGLFCCKGGGLPAHNGGGGDVKNNGGGSSGSGMAGLSPQLLAPGAHIPPKIHGPFPGPYPDPRPRTQ